MYFDVFDYPKFFTNTPDCSLWDLFEYAGFKTYEYDEEHDGHWLDELEFTWF